MTFSLVMFALILGLIVVVLVQFVQYELLEKRFFEVKDGYMNLVIGKKLIERSNYLRRDEKELYNYLREIYGDKYNIVPQVHLSDLADVISGYRDHDNLYFELKRIIFDYVMFDKEFNPVLIIELNGRSHFALNRISRDSRAENFAKNLMIPFLAISTADRYNKEKIKKDVSAVLN